MIIHPALSSFFSGVEWRQNGIFLFYVVPYLRVRLENFEGIFFFPIILSKKHTVLCVLYLLKFCIFLFSFICLKIYVGIHKSVSKPVIKLCVHCNINPISLPLPAHPASNCSIEEVM